MEEAPKTAVPADPPRGSIQVHVDEKWRLKLPSTFKAYMDSFGEKRVFVTSLDDCTIQIYPISLWKENENILDAFTEDPEAAADIAFLANHNGVDCEMDEQGRVLMPQKLRRQLGIESQPVWLDCFKGVINTYSAEIYEERKRRSGEGRAEKLRKLRQKGLK